LCSIVIYAINDPVIVSCASEGQNKVTAQRRKRNFIVIAVIILVTAIVLSSFVYLNSQKPNAEKIESIDVAYSPFESLTLFWVAQEQGFFDQNALNVTSHKYDTGAGALDGVLNNEADIVVGTTEFPFTARALNQARIRTIGSISKSEFTYLVGRTDRGINEISDLKGKTIGTTFGTIAHFYLGRFLVLNGLNFQDVTLVDLKMPAEWVDAVVNGSIDAVATAQPYAEMAKEGLGDNAVVWSIQSSQPLYAQAIATDAWIANNPELVIRFLKSLLQAEDFATNHPTETKEIVKSQLTLSDAYTDKVWSQNQFALSLDQSLILAMESEARWLISNNLTNATAVPNFLDYIYLDGLKTVKPESVDIIH
jgi:ABC-type nitrate/sulfonate/bicarbonate transport system substrate-binding protein